MLGRKAHETSASWNYAFLRYTPTFVGVGGINVGQNCMQSTRKLHKYMLGHFISNHFVTKSIYICCFLFGNWLHALPGPMNHQCLIPSWTKKKKIYIYIYTWTMIFHTSETWTVHLATYTWILGEWIDEKQTWWLHAECFQISNPSSAPPKLPTGLLSCQQVVKLL